MFARNGGSEPDLRVAVRQDIVLHAHVGYEEVVDDVLRGHDELNRLSKRNVQFVDGAISIWIFEGPVPLLRSDLNFGSVTGRNGRGEIALEAPKENQDDQEQWNDGPGDLQGRVMGGVRRDVA